MALTRNFKETVKARAERDPAFREAVLEEVAAVADEATVTLSCGNVFADLNLEDPEEMLLKSRIVGELYRRLMAGSLTVTKVAELMEIGEPDVLQMFKGDLRAYRLERLLGCARKSGLEVVVINTECLE